MFFFLRGCRPANADPKEKMTTLSTSTYNSPPKPTCFWIVWAITRPLKIDVDEDLHIYMMTIILLLFLASWSWIARELVEQNRQEWALWRC
jgi:hypothetical protein